MIPLFHIPQHKIDTSEFSNLLHDKIVREFEEKFAEYVGAKYAVSFNSATSAIFLLFLGEEGTKVEIPTMLPAVVANSLQHNDCDIWFEDNTEWVGNDYVLHEFSDCRIIDSAQHVSKNQFSWNAREGDLMIFSFYPTKPVSGCDGGMVVGNNKEAIEKLRMLSFNGMSQETNNWDRKVIEPGYKMYMNSLQAYMAMQNLKKQDIRNDKLFSVLHIYNMEFGTNQGPVSNHLYRLRVKDNREFITKAAEAGIQCGIHYACLHEMDAYEHMAIDPESTGAGTKFTYPRSEQDARTMVSIPYHENLSKSDIEKIIRFVNENR